MEDLVDEVSGKPGKFPVGLRVLVVDHHFRSLKKAELMLQSCKYNVTATTQPLEALKMLREDKNRFDIVITEISMREMDGFRLSELIEIEMGIPVIMVSTHGKTKDIMKGIQHGAWDYLVKPVRMSELEKIWLHVAKRKRMNEKDKNNAKSKNNQNQVDEQGSEPSENPTTENTETCNDSEAGQKRKGQYEEDDETEDAVTTSHHKPRVVWSNEMHQKFLEAVNHLTIEKATPTKIRDLMNIVGLTKENVASHLQKYRLNLKRSEVVENKQKNSKQMRSKERFGFPEAPRFPTIPIPSTPSSGLLSTHNCPRRMNIDESVPPTLMHQSTSHDMHNSFDPPTKLPQNQLLELFEQKPRLLEVDEFNNLSRFSHPTTSPDNGDGLASSINPETINLANQRVRGEVSHTLSGMLETRYHHATPMNNSRLSHAHHPISSPLMTSAQNTRPNFLVDLSCQEDLSGTVIQNVNCSQRPNGEEQRPVLRHNPNHSTLPLADEIMDHNIKDTENDPDTSQLITHAVDESLEEMNRNLDIPGDGIHPADFNT